MPKTPYPNEHAARVTNPDSFDPKSMRSKDISDGIRIVIGKKPGSETTETQAYRFDKTKFTPAQARAWLKDHDIEFISFEPASETKESVFDSPAANFRLIEIGKSSLLIDVHIIAPGWGSSGYYSESVLRKACEKGVYPAGMHMHLDHPTRAAEKEQPARTIKGESPLAAVLTESGHYDPKGWDGPGVYANARVMPQYIEDIKAMDGHIGISHYVSGNAEDGEAPDGKKGPIIKELLPDSLNTVDFVTVPGAGGHYRTLFSEMKVRQMTDQTEKDIGTNWDQCIKDQMAEHGDEETAKKVCAALKAGTVQQVVASGIAPNVKEARKMVVEKVRNDPLFGYLVGKLQESMNKKEEKVIMDSQVTIKVSEIMADKEVYAEIKRHILKEQGNEAPAPDTIEALKTLCKELEEKVKTLEQENIELKQKLGNQAALEFVGTEIAKAKIPETSGKILTEALIKQIVLAKDGTVNAVEYGKIVTEAIKAKAEEIAAIKKEAGITGNGGGAPSAGDAKKALLESFIAMNIAAGKNKEQAQKLAEIAAEGR